MKIRKRPAFVLPALVPAAGSSLPRRGGGWTVRKSGKSGKSGKSWTVRKSGKDNNGKREAELVSSSTRKWLASCSNVLDCLATTTMTATTMRGNTTL